MKEKLQRLMKVRFDLQPACRDSGNPTVRHFPSAIRTQQTRIRFAAKNFASVPADQSRLAAARLRSNVPCRTSCKSTGDRCYGVRRPTSLRYGRTESVRNGFSVRYSDGSRPKIRPAGASERTGGDCNRPTAPRRRGANRVVLQRPHVRQFRDEEIAASAAERQAERGMTNRAIAKSEYPHPGVDAANRNRSPCP